MFVLKRKFIENCSFVRLVVYLFFFHVYFVNKLLTFIHMKRTSPEIKQYLIDSIRITR